MRDSNESEIEVNDCRDASGNLFLRLYSLAADMDAIPDETLELIIEAACPPSDAGNTARCLCLVSKRFRRIAEPFEFRGIAVSGLRQLQGVIARLKDASTRNRIRVEHMFICDLTKNVALDSTASCETIPFQKPKSGPPNMTNGKRRLPSISVIEQKEAQAFIRRCMSCSRRELEAFWTDARWLLGETGCTLRSLYLLGSHVCEELVSDFLFENSVPEWALNNKSFPKLTSLTIVHSQSYQLSRICRHKKSFIPEGFSFQRPSIPLLSRLRIHSPIAFDLGNSHPLIFHPLLVNFQEKYSNLKQVYIRDDWLSLTNLSHVLYGGDDKILDACTLPAPLESVTVQPGNRREVKENRTEAEELVRAVKRCGIEGLVTCLPDPDRSEYEVLLVEWKEECKRTYD